MDNPRLDSIRKSQDSDFTLDTPEGLLLDKEDRFAAVAKIIEPAVAMFLDSPETLHYVNTVATKRELDTFMQNSIYGMLVDTLNTDEFHQLHSRLEDNQRTQFETKASWTPDYNHLLLAGASTFSNNTSNVFSLFERAYGAEIAAHPSNWNVIDKLARLNVSHQAAYSQIYLSEDLNWTHAITHFTPDTVRGGIKFKPAYPLIAKVPVKSVDPRQRMSGEDELSVDKNSAFIAIKDIEMSGATIGCPVTFQNQSLIRLWSLYAGARQRLSPYQ